MNHATAIGHFILTGVFTCVVIINWVHDAQIPNQSIQNLKVKKSFSITNLVKYRTRFKSAASANVAVRPWLAYHLALLWSLWGGPPWCLPHDPSHSQNQEALPPQHWPPLSGNLWYSLGWGSEQVTITNKNSFSHVENKSNRSSERDCSGIHLRALPLLLELGPQVYLLI